MLVLGKGLSAGYLPAACTVVTDELFEAFRGGPEKTLFYGQTFSGNPVAAAAIRANLDYFAAGRIMEDVPERIETFRSLLHDAIDPLPHIYEVRSLGLIAAVELTEVPGELQPYPYEELVGWKIVREARKRGVIVRPLGNIIYMLPSLSMSVDELGQLVAALRDAVICVTGSEKD